MRPRYSGPLFMLEGRPRSWTKRPRGPPWSRGGRTWPGPTANYWRPPRGSSTHGQTTSLRSPWCVLWPTPGLWLATRRSRSELGSGSERQANEAGRRLASRSNRGRHLLVDEPPGDSLTGQASKRSKLLSMSVEALGCPRVSPGVGSRALEVLKDFTQLFSTLRTHPSNALSDAAALCAYLYDCLRARLDACRG
jgi:hypothetical protein